MTRLARLLIAMLLAALAFTACNREATVQEEEAFRFVVFPGARYLPHITELTKQAHRVIHPQSPEPPATAIYDTEATLDDVTRYYMQEYGFSEIAPNAGTGKAPPAFRREGDLAADAKAIEGLIPKLGLKTDVSKAAGTYSAIELSGKSNRPRVTIQRPYFDVTSSQVVDRTLILMSR